MAANMYDTVKKAIQDIVSPDLRTLEGRFDTLSVEIKRLDEKIDSSYKRLDEKIDSSYQRLDEKFDSSYQRLDEKISGIKEDVNNLRQEVRSQREEFRLAIDIHERLASLEARIPH